MKWDEFDDVSMNFAVNGQVRTVKSRVDKKYLAERPYMVDMQSTVFAID